MSFHQLLIFLFLFPPSDGYFKLNRKRALHDSDFLKKQNAKTIFQEQKNILYRIYHELQDDSEGFFEEKSLPVTDRPFPVPTTIRPHPTLVSQLSTSEAEFKSKVTPKPLLPGSEARFGKGRKKLKETLLPPPAPPSPSEIAKISKGISRIFPPSGVFLVPYDAHIDPDFAQFAPRARGLIHFGAKRGPVDWQFKTGFRWNQVALAGRMVLRGMRLMSKI